MPKKEYGSFNVGGPYVIGNKDNKRIAGYVQNKIGFDKKGNNDTNCEGMQAYVVTPKNKSIS